MQIEIARTGYMSAIVLRPAADDGIRLAATLLENEVRGAVENAKVRILQVLFQPPAGNQGFRTLELSLTHHSPPRFVLTAEVAAGSSPFEHYTRKITLSSCASYARVGGRTGIIPEPKNCSPD